MKIISRHISIVEDGVEILFGERLGIILEERQRFGPGPTRRIICQDARVPTLQIATQVWLAGQRQGHGAKLETPQHAQLKTEPSHAACIQNVWCLHLDLLRTRYRRWF